MAETNHSPKSDKPPQDILGWLDYYLVEKAPFQLPKDVREWIVKYSPWINIVILVLLSPVILLALGLGAIALPFSVLGGATAGLSIALVALIVQVVLMIAALPGLFARKKAGWNLTLYSVGFSLLHSLLSFNVLGGLISALLGAYVLFQIRSYYK